MWCSGAGFVDDEEREKRQARLRQASERAMIDVWANLLLTTSRTSYSVSNASNHSRMSTNLQIDDSASVWQRLNRAQPSSACDCRPEKTSFQHAEIQQLALRQGTLFNIDCCSSKGQIDAVAATDPALRAEAACRVRR